MNELMIKYWEKFGEDPYEQKGLMEDPEKFEQRLKFSLHHGIKLSESTSKPGVQE